MKKILFISIIAILLANSIMAGGTKEEATLDQLGRIKEKGEITIAMEGTWAPWTYHNEKDELVGYDTEVGKAIAEKLGVKPVFIEGEWDGLLAGLDAGRYDIMINGVDYTEERGKKYDFSTPYAYNRTAVITSIDNTAISSMEDLKGKKTANTISSTYAEVAEKYGANVTGVDDLIQTFELLMSGRIDATSGVIPFKKGDDSASLREAVDKALEELREDGTLSALSIKYFGTDITGNN